MIWQMSHLRLVILALIPLLTTCSLKTFPNELNIRMSLSEETVAGVLSSRAPALSDLNCFVFVFRKAGLDEVSDSMTSLRSHQCLGIEGTLSPIVDFETAKSGVALSLASGTYSGEVFGFYTSGVSCRGKTLTQVFSQSPAVYTVGSFSSTDIKAGATLTIPATYSSGTTVDRTGLCPRALSCSPAGSVNCTFSAHVTSDNYYGLYVANSSGLGLIKLLESPDIQWASAESVSNIGFNSTDYLYMVAWNVGFQRGILFNATVGAASFASSLDNTVATLGPGHFGNSTIISDVALTNLLSLLPTWYSPEYFSPNDGMSVWNAVVSGMGTAKWLWIDHLNAPGESHNLTPGAVFYVGSDSDSNFVVFRSKCRLIEIAGQAPGCL